jgi:hypothetical protein
VCYTVPENCNTESCGHLGERFPVLCRLHHSHFLRHQVLVSNTFQAKSRTHSTLTLLRSVLKKLACVSWTAKIQIPGVLGLGTLISSCVFCDNCRNTYVHTHAWIHSTRVHTHTQRAHTTHTTRTLTFFKKVKLLSFFFAILGIDVRSSCLPGKHSSTWGVL